LRIIRRELVVCDWTLAREGLLFDNCIGRKRDVDGGVLAGIPFWGGV